MFQSNRVLNMAHQTDQGVVMSHQKPLRRISSALSVALLVTICAFGAQTQTQAVTPQSPELVEASRLAAEVVQLYNKKQYDEALPLSRRVLEIRQQALGPEHPQVGDAAQNLAAVQMARKNYGEALSPYQRA